MPTITVTNEELKELKKLRKCKERRIAYNEESKKNVAIFNSKPTVPRKDVFNLKPGVWLKIKWNDDPKDSIGLLLLKPNKDQSWIRILDCSDNEYTIRDAGLDQVTYILGTIEKHTLAAVRDK